MPAQLTKSGGSLSRSARPDDDRTREAFGKGYGVLVIDDSEIVREFLKDALEEVGFSVQTADSLESARRMCSESQHDLVLADKNLPDGNGLEIARDLANRSSDCEVILVTGDASLESAVNAIQLHVADYITKSEFESMSVVLGRIQRVLAMLVRKRRNRTLLDELRRDNEQLQALVIRDSLTRLFTHGHLQECVEREIEHCKRHDRPFSVVLIGINEFEKITERSGPAIGDALLQFMAGLLGADTRRSDLGFHLAAPEEGEIAARIGGDTFALVLPETTKRGGAARAERLRAALDALDFEAAGLPAFTAAIGVASFPDDSSDRPGLLAAAEAAMHAAKRTGGNRLVSFTPALIGPASDPAQAAEQELRLQRALERLIQGRLYYYLYQPIVQANSAEVFGYEALCRPTEPGFSNIRQLLSTAERAGRISELGVVLREASTAAVEQLPPPLCLFVNLHPFVLNAELVRWAVAHRSWSQRVVLEITEATVIEDYTSVIGILRQIRQLGFRIALDDLGEGYSALNSLALLQPDYLKLGMASLRDLQPDSQHARVVRHLFDFARGANMQVIAEGVETPEEWRVVRQLGCELAQGYLFAYPSPPFCSVTNQP